VIETVPQLGESSRLLAHKIFEIPIEGFPAGPGKLREIA
jgi:hypothetical protein